MDSQFDIACVGTGFVGLYTAIACADADYAVTAVDIDSSIIEKISEGVAPISLPGNYERKLETAVKNGQLTATTAFDEDHAGHDVYIVSVPTPLDEKTEPDLSYLEAAAAEIATFLSKGDLVVLQSTVYPTYTRSKLLSLLEESGLEAGEDFGLSYVPERYSPGNVESLETPRLVGSITDRWQEISAELYESLGFETVQVDSLEVTEAAKQIENIQRDVNIALMNECKQRLDGLDVDIWKVIEAAETKWNFHSYTPGLGVGGHCIPVDPVYFLEPTATHSARRGVIEAARRINGRMPTYYFDRLREKLETAGVNVEAATVAVLGVSYKPGIQDLRNSPALEFIRLLRDTGCTVRIYDPIFESGATITDELVNAESVLDACQGASVTVIGVDNTYDSTIETLTKQMKFPKVILDPYDSLDGLSGSDATKMDKELEQPWSK